MVDKPTNQLRPRCERKGSHMVCVACVVFFLGLWGFNINLRNTDFIRRDKGLNKRQRDMCVRTQFNSIQPKSIHQSIPSTKEVCSVPRNYDFTHTKPDDKPPEAGHFSRSKRKIAMDLRRQSHATLFQAHCGL